MLNANRPSPSTVLESRRASGRSRVMQIDARAGVDGRDKTSRTRTSPIRASAGPRQLPGRLHHGGGTNVPQFEGEEVSSNWGAGGPRPQAGGPIGASSDVWIRRSMPGPGATPIRRKAAQLDPRSPAARLVDALERGWKIDFRCQYNAARGQNLALPEDDVMLGQARRYTQLHHGRDPGPTALPALSWSPATINDNGRRGRTPARHRAASAWANGDPAARRQFRLPTSACNWTSPPARRRADHRPWEQHPLSSICRWPRAAPCPRASAINPT